MIKKAVNKKAINKKIKSSIFSPLFTPMPITAIERLEYKNPGYKLNR